MMKKSLRVLPLALLLLVSIAVFGVERNQEKTIAQQEAVAPLTSNKSAVETTFLGDGNINPLEQWKSDGTNITQRTASKPVKITGLSDGCTYLLSGVLTTNVSNPTCASGGGGGGGGGTMSTSTVAGNTNLLNNYMNNATDVFEGGGVSGTSTAKFFLDPNGTQFYRIGNANTASTTIMGGLQLPTYSQGAFYLGSAGQVKTVSTSTPTASTGLTYSGTFGSELGGVSGNLTVNTSQNINTLSNLTSNGLVYTAGSNGTLNIIASSSLNVGTATALAANGANCSAGNYPLGVDASGAVENCTAANTGTVTSVTLATPNSTLSLGGTNPVTTSGTINADLNLGNANIWTALQRYSNASTTLLSVFNKAYFGGTATTTIDSTGNIVIPSGSNLTVTGKSDGCATWATGVLNSTGVACGSGGSSTPNLTYLTLSGTAYYTASTTLTDNKSFYFGNGFVSNASSTIPIAFLHLIGASDGCVNITSGVLGSTGSGCGSASGLASYDAFTHSALFTPNSATTSKIGIGTTTPYYSLTIASSTGAQLSLGDGTAGDNLVAFRNAGGNFYITTTTAQGLATTSNSAFTIVGSNGNVGIGTTGDPTKLLQVGSGINIQSSAVNAIAIAAPAANIILRDSNVSNGEFNMNWNSSDFQLGLVNGVSPQTLSLKTGNASKLTVDGATGVIGIGTTTFSTYAGRLTIASTTQPQLSLMGNDTDNKWNFRSIGNSLFIGTSSPTSVATSSVSAFSLNTNGFPTFSSLGTGLVKSTAGLLGLGANGTDYTLINGTTCGGTDKVSAISASGSITCTTDSTGGGAGSGLSTTTADYIIYQSGTGTGVTNSLYTPTNTVISSNASADVVLRATLAHATSTIGNNGADIYFKAGTYYLNATTTFYGKGVDTSSGNVWKLSGAGIDQTKFVVNNNADGFALTNRVRADFRNFTVYIKGSANAFTATSSIASGYQSVWNSTFDSLFVESTSTSASGTGFNFTNDYRNNFNNIQFYSIGNCIRSATDGKGLNNGDTVYSNIMCSTINNTLSGTVAFDFDGTANSSANQVNDNTFIDVNAFANLGSKTAWRFRHALWMNIETTNPEGFSTTTELYSNSSNNTIRIQYAIGSTTASTYFYTDSGSTANVFGCQYIDSYNASHKLWIDNNTNATDPNIIQGYANSTCDLRGTGTYAFSTTSASIVRDLDNNGANYLAQVKLLGDRLSLNFASGGNKYIQSDGFGLNLWNNGNAGLTVNSSGNVGIHNQSPQTTLDVSGSGVISSNAWVTSTTGGWWLDSFNSFNVGYLRNAAGDSFLRTNGLARVSILNNGEVGIATSTATASYPLTSFSSTLPQLSLSQGAGQPQWTMRNAGGDLFFSTTTVQGLATSSTAALTLKGNGKPGLGISTTTAMATLTVNSINTTDYSNLLSIGTSTATYTSGRVSLQVDNNGVIYFGNYSDCDDATHALGILSKKIVCDASISDIRFKKDVEPLTDGLDTIMALKPVTFYWNDKAKAEGKTSTQKQYGLIAQDVQKILPSAVEGTPSELTLDKTALIAPLVKAVQELAQTKGGAPMKQDNTKLYVLAFLFLAYVAYNEFDKRNRK